MDEHIKQEQGENQKSQGYMESPRESGREQTQDGDPRKA
jgi:hypothetical protein